MGRVGGQTSRAQAALVSSSQKFGQLAKRVGDQKGSVKDTCMQGAGEKLE